MCTQALKRQQVMVPQAACAGLGDLWNLQVYSKKEKSLALLRAKARAHLQDRSAFYRRKSQPDLVYFF